MHGSFCLFFNNSILSPIQTLSNDKMDNNYLVAKDIELFSTCIFTISSKKYLKMGLFKVVSASEKLKNKSIFESFFRKRKETSTFLFKKQFTKGIANSADISAADLADLDLKFF